MTLKLAQFCDDPKKISTRSSYPQKIFIFLKTQRNIEIQNFEPKKISVGRCVIPWEFLGKSVKHIFSCREMYSV